MDNSISAKAANGQAMSATRSSAAARRGVDMKLDI